MTLPFALAVVLAGLGAAYATRVLRASSLLDRPRGFVLGRVRRVWRRVDELVACPWCLGVWVSGAAVAGERLSGLLPGRWWVLWLAWPAAALFPGRLG